MTARLTSADVQNLPAVVDLVTAAGALGIGRTKAYELAQAEEFPCPVLRIGRSYKVPTAGLAALLGLTTPSHREQGDSGDEADDPPWNDLQALRVHRPQHR